MFVFLVPVFICATMSDDSDTWRCKGNHPFCLWMSELCGCGVGDAENGSENIPLAAEPPKKTLKLSLSRPACPSKPQDHCKPHDGSKPHFERVDEGEMSTICNDYIHRNTAKSTRWSVGGFNEWKASRNCEAGKVRCPNDLLECADATERSFWLVHFVAKVRRTDGKPYPPKSIHQLLSSILRHMRSLDPCRPNILNRKDKRFPVLHKACEVVFCRLHQSGDGTDMKHTAVIEKGEEDQLWSLGVMNISDPTGLQLAVFYYIGKVYCVHGGKEQRNLKPSQFVHSCNPDCNSYIEHGSKNYSGKLA